MNTIKKGILTLAALAAIGNASAQNAGPVQQPSAGQIDFKDLPQGVEIKPDTTGTRGSFGNHFNVFEDSRGNKRLNTNGPIAFGESFEDLDSQDGVKQNYTVEGIDGQTGKPTGASMESSFVPFGNDDWKMKVEGSDVDYNNWGDLDVEFEADFDANPGNEVSYVRFTAKDSTGKVLDSEQVFNLEDVLEGVTLRALDTSRLDSTSTLRDSLDAVYDGEVKVYASLGLERGSNEQVSTTVDVERDMPGWVIGFDGLDRTVNGYEEARIAVFPDSSEANAAWNQLQLYEAHPDSAAAPVINPAYVNVDTLAVDGTNANAYVKCWELPNGDVVSYDKTGLNGE